MNAANDGKTISPINFDKKAYQNSEIYKAKSDIEKQTSEYLKIKKEQEEARKIAKESSKLSHKIELKTDSDFIVTLKELYLLS